MNIKELEIVRHIVRMGETGDFAEVAETATFTYTPPEMVLQVISDIAAVYPGFTVKIYESLGQNKKMYDVTVTDTTR